ncbi:MAG: glutaredoxin family protein [Porticoccaceae bacterium]
MNIQSLPAMILAALWMLAGAPLAEAEIYTWKDADGKVHFSDKKPEGSGATSIDVRVNTITSPSISDSEFLSAREAGQVVMYSAEWCGICKKARKYFQQQGIPFREYDIETSRKGRQDYESLNGRGVPIILVGSKRMDGFSAERFQSLYKGSKVR